MYIIFALWIEMFMFKTAGSLWRTFAMVRPIYRYTPRVSSLFCICVYDQYAYVWRSAKKRSSEIPVALPSETIKRKRYLRRVRVYKRNCDNTPDIFRYFRFGFRGLIRVICIHVILVPWRRNYACIVNVPVRQFVMIFN